MTLPQTILQEIKKYFEYAHLGDKKHFIAFNVFISKFKNIFWWLVAIHYSQGPQQGKMG